MNFQQEQGVNDLLDRIRETYGTEVDFSKSVVDGQPQYTATARDVVIPCSDGTETHPLAMTESKLGALKLLNNVLRITKTRLQPAVHEDSPSSASGTPFGTPSPLIL